MAEGDGYAYVGLGDSAGAKNFEVRDSSGAMVLGVNSYGNSIPALSRTTRRHSVRTTAAFPSTSTAHRLLNTLPSIVNDSTRERTPYE